jgi:3-oxoacyl-(acyl-carrier-protein) synthase
MRTIILALCLTLAGCHAATTAPPPLAPGALNQFDQTSYQTLLAVQATIHSLQDSYNANPTGLESIKAPLNQATADYNLADIAWQTYHASATAANQTAVTSALTKVQTDVSSIKVTP